MSTLQSRLNKYIQIHNILNPEQFEFRLNARTTDSLFILQQLLHKYTKQHEKLSVGFSDYEKAFDRVWQSGTWHKLQKEGIKGKFLKVIKSMYPSITAVGAVWRLIKTQWLGASYVTRAYGKGRPS